MKLSPLSSSVGLGLLGVLLVFSGQYLTVQLNFGGNWTALFCTGKLVELPPSLGVEEVDRSRENLGYDGQFYHLIAHDPLLTKGFVQYIDNPRLRWRRVLIPGLAHLLALGRDRQIDAAYIVVNLFFVFLGVYWLSRYFASYKLDAAWGLSFLVVPSVVVSVDRMTIDLALAALCVGFILYATRYSAWRSHFLLALCPLARETGLCLTLGQTVASLRERKWKEVLFALATAIPFFVWVGFVNWNTAPDATDWFALPFQGIMLRTLNPVQFPLTGP